MAYSQSILEGSQGRNRKAEAMEECCLLPRFSGSLSSLPYTFPDCLPKNDTAHGMLVPSTAVTNKEDVPQLPSFQMSLGCVGLTNNLSTHTFTCFHREWCTLLGEEQIE